MKEQNNIPCVCTQGIEQKSMRRIDYSLFYSLLFIINRVAEGLKPIPAAIGQDAVYTLDKSPVCHRANIEGQTTIHTHTSH